MSRLIPRGIAPATGSACNKATPPQIWCPLLQPIELEPRRVSQTTSSSMDRPSSQMLQGSRWHYVHACIHDWNFSVCTCVFKFTLLFRYCYYDIILFSIRVVILIMKNFRHPHQMIRCTKVAEAGKDDEAVIVATFDLAALRTMRHAWGLFRDRRPELYRPLLSLDGTHIH